jgi:hypothetical protein
MEGVPSLGPEEEEGEDEEDAPEEEDRGWKYFFHPSAAAAGKMLLLPLYVTSGSLKANTLLTPAAVAAAVQLGSGA